MHISLKCIVFLYVIKYIIVNDCFVICVGLLYFEYKPFNFKLLYLLSLDPLKILQKQKISENSKVDMSHTVQDPTNGITYFFVSITKTNETFVLEVEPKMPNPHCFEFKVGHM